MGFNVYPGIISAVKSLCNDVSLPFNGPDFDEIIKNSFFAKKEEKPIRFRVFSCISRYLQRGYCGILAGD